MERLSERLTDLQARRRWIVATDVAAAVTSLVSRLQETGVMGVMVVAGAEGVGELPDCPTVYVRSGSGGGLMDRIRAIEAAIANPPAGVVEAVDRFDPDRRASVIATSFWTATTLFGRPVYGARRPEWVALEDKTLVDGLWDAAGVPRVPSRVVSVAEAADVADDLAGPLGTVWSADNSEGWHGGGTYTRWVSDSETARQATDWFSLRARQVRVMPFLDGIPCSIHGFVTWRGEAVFRPVELVILRRVDRRGFVYGGVATFWDPPGGLREEMRAVGRRVAATLLERVGYLGPFGIDGVATADGFRPTELNPRMTVGLGVQAAGADLALGLVARAAVEGDLDPDPEELEELVVHGADAARVSSIGVPLDHEVDPAQVALTFRGDGVEVVDGDGEAEATMDVGPAGAGGSYLRMRLDPERVDAGPSVAPKAVAACRLAAELWGAELPDLEAAPDLGRSPHREHDPAANRAVSDRP